ncbi:hypothetical protein BGZ80_006293 [Entomortierella chlamydospora]|uniref:Uncharacterized protein n=1 Tax=Entomortierella chlamydospora TaxID=101097 RepID=A0A9P6N5W2_9FUNG|nr:hypothetical protein BGZ79_008124 [Entomortierella chlamydospora]KAG0024068.1 hypothetical protein BGZ80_006293 [Entomortierella chlamydospora]
MLNNTSRAVRLSGIVFAVLATLLFLRAISRSPSDDQRPNKFRVEEPVVVILVHPSPSLNKAANFELKRAIAKTWAKDVEDLGASVFFVGEHDGETVMRRPSEFQGRAESLSSRFGPGSLLAKEDTDATGEGGYSKEEPVRKMLIPSVLENGKADNPSGYLKARNTTHYVHVQNLVMTLLSSRPRRLLTMKDDLSFSGPVSEASECSAEDFGDKAPPQSGDGKANSNNHWTLSRAHLVSKQLVAMIGPHLHRCINDTASTSADSGEAFKTCVENWTSNPLFWKNGYCGRLSTLRYQAPAPGSFPDPMELDSFNNRFQRRSPPTSPEDFTEFYHVKQREREAAAAAGVDKADLLKPREETPDRQKSRKILQQLTNSSPESPARWIIASGLTQADDFALIYQGLSESEGKEEDLDDLEDLEDLEDY